MSIPYKTWTAFLKIIIRILILKWQNQMLQTHRVDVKMQTPPILKAISLT